MLCFFQCIDFITCNIISCDKDCPVVAFRLYLGKLHPKNYYFWQRPQKVVNMTENLGMLIITWQSVIA